MTRAANRHPGAERPVPALVPGRDHQGERQRDECRVGFLEVLQRPLSAAGVFPQWRLALIARSSVPHPAPRSGATNAPCTAIWTISRTTDQASSRSSILMETLLLIYGSRVGDLTQTPSRCNHLDGDYLPHTHALRRLLIAEPVRTSAGVLWAAARRRGVASRREGSGRWPGRGADRRRRPPTGRASCRRRGSRNDAACAASAGRSSDPLRCSSPG